LFAKNIARSSNQLQKIILQPESLNFIKKEMRNLLFLAIIAFSFAQASCDKGGPIKTKGGNTVINHTNNDGPKITNGQTVLISVNTWLNDSLIQSTQRDNEGPREFTLPDSSAMKGRVPAVFEALLLLANGDSATVLQPVDSIMKRSIPKEFGEVKQIRFELRVVDILTPEKIAQREADEQKKMEGVKSQGVEVAAIVKTAIDDYKANKLGDKLQKSASGLEYIVLDKGAGASIKDGDKIPTNYYGVLKSNGTMFDNSFDRGGAAPFTVGGLVPGFNEGMKLLNKGGKAILFIPYDLAYGEAANGPIPAKADLVFYIAVE
jgi:FKBP-type peptidyl-prolyl cis-trans isomerase FkpA